MKTIGSSMWKWCAGLALAAGLFVAAPQASADVLVGWDVTNQTSYGVSPLAPSSTLSGVTVNTNLTKKAGNSGTAAGNAWGGTGFNSTTSYWYFTVSPSTGKKLSHTNLVINYRRTATGPTNALIQYRVGGGSLVDITSIAFPVTASTGSVVNVNLSGVSALQNCTDPITYWVTPTNASAGTGPWYIYNRVTGLGGNDMFLEGTVADAAAAPSVTTEAASDVAATTAKGNGNVTADGGATVTERGVCYKTSAGVAITDNKTAAAAGGTGTYSVDLSSLSVNQIYYFKAYASNSVGETLSATELNFTTLANVPAAPTVNNPTASTLDVAVNENSNPSATEFAIQCTNNSQYVQADGTLGASAVWATKTAWGTKTVTGLSASTTYGFQVKARNGANVETAFGGVTDGTTSAAATGIWINPMSAGTPMGTYYLGDTLGDWYVNFEIGQTSWDDARVGIGTSLAGTGYNYGTANWYEDGEGSNKRVRRNLSGIQFTATGSHYVICQAEANEANLYTSKSGNGWSNSTAYPPADLSSAYFTVDALTAPSSVSAAQDGTHPATRVDLSWTQWNSKNVLITRATATPSGSPTQGQAYSANDTFGNQTVVSGSQSGTSLEVTGLVPGQTYYYTFYSVNSSYYSAGATASSVTLAMPQARNTSGGSPEAPATIFLGDSGQTFGFDSWGQIEANYGAARLWLRHDNADLTGGTASDWTGFVNDENKTRASGTFDQTGTWYWGLQMDYGAEYGTAFWYKAASADWADLSASGAGASLTVTVSAINDPSGQSADADQTTQINLLWSNNAQGHDVMVVRKLAADSWTEPTQGTSYSASDLLGAGTVVYKGDSGVFYDTGLSAGTTYDYKFYSVNNDYYSAGVTAQETTLACEPDAPTGLDAVADYTSFTASWDATDRATGYRLDVSTNAAFGIASALGSVYTADFEDSVKGSYASGLTTNNGVVWTFNDAVVGTLANDRKNGSRSARMRTNNTFSGCGTLTMNSDTNMGLSSITLLYAVYGTDSVGDSGQVEYSTNSGSSWVSAGTFTASSTTLTLFTATNINVTGNVRVRVVKTTGTSRLNIDDIKLYPYAPAVPSFVAGYENLAVAGTSQEVSGLAEGVTYYFRVRAEGEGGCPSANSTTASTTTLEHLRPSLSLDEVNVREAGQGRFYVRLNQNPAASVVVSVSRTAGSANLSVQGGSSLTFNSANWSTWRLVTLAAAADADSTDDTATFRIAMSGADDQFVEATALDDDIGENLALPAGGSTIEGKTAYSAAALIDGVHNVQTNYGYTVWTNLANPGTLTLDLHATSVVSRVRLLNYDWNYRVHQYRIDSSLNGTDWTLLADASTGEHTGWEDWPVANQQMRYLRFTGLSNSMNRSVCVSELEVFGTRTQPVPLEFSKTSVNVREAGEGRFYVRMTNAPESLLVVNVARDSGDGSLSVKSGATLTFDALNWNTWKAVTLQAPADENADDETATFRVSAPGVAYTYIEAKALDDDIGENLALGAETEGKTGYLTSQLVDGTHLVNTNYGYTVWTNLASPGTITLDLQSVVSASRMRLLNWDFRYRVHQYLIESSTDGDNWSVLVDASTGAHSGWEDWTLDAEQIRYLRFTGLSNSENRAVCISEWELYGEARENQTITFPNPGTQERTNTVVLSATASSGLPVSFAVASGPASISGGTTLTFSGTGLVSIVASQAGDGNWNPAPNVTNVFNVLLPKSTVDFGGGDVNVREGGEGRFFVRLSEQPANDVVVSVTRSAGDAGISVQSGITMTFTPLTWDTWRAVTLVAAEDENSTDESATIRIVATGVPEQFLQAVALDDDIGENVALASGGATVTGSISVAVTDVIDGIHTDRYNYGYTVWTNEPQDVIDLDLGAVMTVTRMRLLNFDWNYRMHQYQIESSLDGETWDLLVDASTGAHHGWEDWSLENVSARYLRFTGLSNTYNRAVCISEWEVYGTRPAGRRAVKAAVAAAAEVVPTVVLTSDGAEDESGWNAVDGDEETAWVGQQVGGGYVVVGYESALELKSIEVDLAEGSLSGIQYLYSQDGEEWLPLPDLAGNPISLNYLWLVFPDDGTMAVPQVLEILPNP